jgi:hypothetical protein
MESNERIEKLRAELNEVVIGADGATPESIARIAQNIRDSQAEIDALSPEHIGTPEHKIALEALHLLKREYDAQTRLMTVNRAIENLVDSVARVQDAINEAEGVIDANSEFDQRLCKRLATFYVAALQPGIDKCRQTPLREILEIPAGK